jgi:hypothetical protein
MSRRGAALTPAHADVLIVDQQALEGRPSPSGLRRSLGEGQGNRFAATSMSQLVRTSLRPCLGSRANAIACEIR